MSDEITGSVRTGGVFLVETLEFVADRIYACAGWLLSHGVSVEGRATERESYLETIQVVRDHALLENLKESLEQANAGELHEWDDVRRELNLGAGQAHH